jgi:eukaryotic-like serine/threonine-protein kinase
MALPDIHPHPKIVPGVGIGPWLVRERWDRGSFGVVFRVERAGHPALGSFALKLALHPGDPRFAREVRLLESTSHPSVPHFEDRGCWKSQDGRDFPYVVMEWVRGVPLYEWARDQSPTSAQVLRLMAQVAGALAVAHRAGFVHRDVKGDNILVTPEGRAVLLDWGSGIHPAAKPVTDTCLPPGTALYRTPEALRWSWAHRMDGQPYTASSSDDVYALGVTAYRLCTGTYPPQPPEGSESPRRFLPPRELATVSHGLGQLVLAALSQEHRARPSAFNLAIAFSAAAEEPEAAKPIVPTPSAVPTDEGGPPDFARSRPLPPPGKKLSDTKPASPRPAEPQQRLLVRYGLVLFVAVVVLSGVSAGVASALVVMQQMLPSPPPPDPTPWLATPKELAPFASDGGVAEEALVKVQASPRAEISSSLALGRTMPFEPLPGQKTPPCDPRSRVIVGGCWVGPIGNWKPPCGSDFYDGEDGCYMPVIKLQRQPTSQEP